MHNSRPILGPHMDIDWPQHKIALNRVLLVAALALAAVGVAILVAGSNGQVNSVGAPAFAMLVSATWLLLVYGCSRTGRALAASWLLVLFSLTWLGALLFVLPGYTVALLPAACLPIGIAILLLDRKAVVFSVTLTLAVVLAVSLLPLPPPPLALLLPLNQLQFGLVIFALTSALLSLLLLPLRSAHTALTHELAIRDRQLADLSTAHAAVQQARDQALNTVARQHQHLEALADHVRDGVLGVDATGRIVRANAVARDLYANMANETNGQPSLDGIEQALVVTTNELAKADLLPLPDAGLGPEEAYTHILIDRREEARLARLRGELLGLLTDEMRNPLTSMVTALDLTLGQQNVPEEIDRVLIGARQSGQRLVELVTMLLDISQIEQNADVLRRNSIALSRVIESGIAQISPLAQRNAVTVTVEHAGESVIALDGDRVQRAFTYLLEQALRESPPYSVVHIRTRRAENQLVVQITDQGSGRTQSNDGMRASGDDRAIASLGLIYSRIVIEAHHGRLWIEANGGQGTSYSFALPLEQQELLTG